MRIPLSTGSRAFAALRSVDDAAGLRPCPGDPGPPDVVAVVLCWNDAPRVLALLDRLEQLDRPPDRVLVVDNGSADGSADAIAAAFPCCDILRLRDNFGFAGAVNQGIAGARRAGARWVWLLNTDIELPTTALRSLLAVGEADARVGMVGALLTEADGRLQARGGGRVSLWTGSSRHVVSPDESPDYLSAACLLLRRTMLEETGAFDQGYFFYWEDVDLGFRARQAGWRLAVAEDCRVVHREGSTLGRWSARRWDHLFFGMVRFLRSRARFPRLAMAVRLAVHGATMLRHGRVDAVRGAWRGARRGLALP